MNALNAPAKPEPLASETEPEPPRIVEVDVAHEALVQRWPVAQDWINADRVALRLRQDLADAANDWIEAGADPLDEDRLSHRGSSLTLAEKLPQTLREDFNRRERRYLDACIAQRKRLLGKEEAQRQRELRIKNRWFTIVSLVAVVAIGLAAASGFFYVEQRRQARVSLAQALAANAMTELAAGHTAEAALLARQAYAFDVDSGTAEAQIAEALQLTAGSPYFSSLAGTQQSWISGLAFSPDGRQLASSSSDGTVALMDVEDPTLPQTVTDGGSTWVASVAFHPLDRSFPFASGSGDGTVQLRNAGDGEAVGQPMPGPGGAISSLAFDRGTRLAAGSCTMQGKECAKEGAVVRIWTIDAAATGQALQFEDRTLGTRHVCAVEFSPDGRWLAAGGCSDVEGDVSSGCSPGTGPLVVWDLTQPAGTAPTCLNGHQGSIWSVAFSPDGKTLASGGSDASIRLWNIGAIAPGSVSIGAFRLLNGHDEDVRSVSFSGDGQLLASGSHDGSVGLWYVGGIKPTLFRLGSTTEHVRAVTFGGESGRILATVSAGGKIRLWDLKVTGMAPSVLRGHADYVRSLAFSPATGADTPPILASGAEDGTVRLWTLGASAVESIFLPMDAYTELDEDGPPEKVSSVAFSRDGRWLAAAGDDGDVLLWDGPAGRPDPIFVADHASTVTHVAFSPAEDVLVSAGWTGDIYLWDMQGNRIGDPLCLSDAPPEAPEMKCNHKDRKDLPTRIAFNQDGSLLAAGDDAGTVRVWDLSAGAAAPRTIATFSTPIRVTALAFQPHGSVLAIGGADGATRLWNIPSQTIVRRLTGHDGEVRSVAFSPNGDQMVTGGIDQTVMIWNPAEWDDPPVQIRDLAEWIRSVAYSPDGDTLAATSTQGTIRLIAIRTEDLAERACARLTRNLTPDEWNQFVGDDGLNPLDWILDDDIGEYRLTCPNLPPGRDEPEGAPVGTAEAAALRGGEIRLG